jgi:hypothetical protein
MNCYVHNVPGRLRLKNPLFKNSAPLMFTALEYW